MWWAKTSQPSLLFAITLCWRWSLQCSTGRTGCVCVCVSQSQETEAWWLESWTVFQLWLKTPMENTNLEMSMQVGSARQEQGEGKYTPSCFPTCGADIVVLFAALLFSPFLLLLLWLLINYEYISGQKSGLAAWGSVQELRWFPEWMIALCVCPLHCSHCPEYCVHLSVFSMYITMASERFVFSISPVQETSVSLRRETEVC